MCSPRDLHNRLLRVERDQAAQLAKCRACQAHMQKQLRALTRDWAAFKRDVAEFLGRMDRHLGAMCGKAKPV